MDLVYLDPVFLWDLSATHDEVPEVSQLDLSLFRTSCIWDNLAGEWIHTFGHNLEPVLYGLIILSTLGVLLFAIFFREPPRRISLAALGL